MVYQPTIIEPNEWLPNELYTYLYYLPSCFPINELDSCVRIKNIWEEFFHYRVNLWYTRVTVRGISRNKMKKKKNCSETREENSTRWSLKTRRNGGKSFVVVTRRVVTSRRKLKRREERRRNEEKNEITVWRNKEFRGRCANET